MAKPIASFLFFLAALILAYATAQGKTEVSCHEKAALGCYSGCHYFKLSDKPGCAEICECSVPQQIDEILELVTDRLQKISACCSNTQQRYCYNACRQTGSSQSLCASLCNCKLVTNKPPSCY